MIQGNIYYFAFNCTHALCGYALVIRAESARQANEYIARGYGCPSTVGALYTKMEWKRNRRHHAWTEVLQEVRATDSHYPTRAEKEMESPTE